MTTDASVIHVNVVGFMAAVAALVDSERERRAFVVGFPGASRAVVLDVSRNALEEGIEAGMFLEEARRRVRDLLVVPPSFDACRDANLAMERVCSRFAPVVENDCGGHFYLDMRGTRRLFGEYVDSAARIKNEIAATVGLEPVVALAVNKLVAKVGTRSLRPDGLASIREGDEAEFLAPQDVELLRDSARGLDFREVADGSLAERIIAKEARFESDVLDAFEVRAALLGLVEEAGLHLRREALAARRLGISVAYTDGVVSSASDPGRTPLASDARLIGAADRLLAKAGARRVRVRGLRFCLGGLEPVSPQLDLFSPPEPPKAARLQKAVDAARLRFGADKITVCAALGKAGLSRV